MFPKTFSVVVIVFLSVVILLSSGCMSPTSSILSASSTGWDKEETKHFRMFFDRQGYSATERDSLKLVMEQNYLFVLSKLKENPNDDDYFTHFMVKTPARYAELTKNQSLFTGYSFHGNFFSAASVINQYLITVVLTVLVSHEAALQGHQEKQLP